MKQPKTAVFNVRMDLMALATIHKYYTNKGMETDTISTLTRLVIESHAAALVEKYDAEPFLTTANAKNYFEALGMLKPLMGQGRTAIIKQMQHEALESDGFNTDYMQKKGKTTVDPDQFRAAKRALNTLREKEDEENLGAILGKTPGTIKGGEKDDGKEDGD